MKTTHLIFLFLLTISLIGCQDENEGIEKGDIYVSVLTNSGYSLAPLKGASVFTVPSTKQVTTDEFGTVLLKDIEVGSYEIFANMEGYGSGKSVVRVRPDSLIKVSIQIIKGVKTGFTPEIELTLPTIPANFSFNEKVVFSLNVKDNDTSPDNITVVISSNLDGKLYETHPDALNNIKFETTTLSRGRHDITITATDKDKYSSVLNLQVSTLAPGKIELESAAVNAGKVLVGWKKYAFSDFQRYEVYRTTASDLPGQIIGSYSSIDSLKFTDKTPPISAEAFYYVRVVNTDNQFRNSNLIRVAYPGGKIYFYSPVDAVHHPSESILYVVDIASNKLVSVNYATNTEIISSSLAGTIGRIDIGDNGFGVEIYVPSSDGNIYIYDAATLNYKTKINTGLPTRCVVTNGHGYLLASVSPSPWWEMPVRTYSRSSGLNISGNEGGFGTVFEGGILKFIPKTDYAIQISQSVSPTDLDYFELDNSGKVLLQKDDTYHGDYPLDHRIFRISNDGSYFVTGQTGAIYTASQNLRYKGEIPRGALTFSDFAFSNDGLVIYAATSNRTSIQIVKYPELTRNDEYLMKGYPKFIFNYKNEIISVSSINLSSENFAIERVALK